MLNCRRSRLLLRAGSREKVFFLVEPRDEITLAQKSTAYHIGLGRRESHPTNEEKVPGEMLYARTCLRRAVWDWCRADGYGDPICVAPEGVSASYPLKPQDFCTTRNECPPYL